MTYISGRRAKQSFVFAIKTIQRRRPAIRLNDILHAAHGKEHVKEILTKQIKQIVKI